MSVLRRSKESSKRARRHALKYGGHMAAARLRARLVAVGEQLPNIVAAERFRGETPSRVFVRTSSPQAARMLAAAYDLTCPGIHLDASGRNVVLWLTSDYNEALHAARWARGQS